MFTAAFSTIAKRWKQPKCPSTDEQINTMWYIHIMEHYSTIKRNEVQLHTTTWVNLENMMLNERTQT